MKITEISRTISGLNYSNISGKAIIEDDENIVEAAKLLDVQLRNSLNTIERTQINVDKTRSEITKDVSILEDALKYAKGKLDDLPF